MSSMLDIPIFVLYGIYMLLWKEPLKFDWDEGNLTKPQKHDISREQAESIFFYQAKKIYFDHKHSQIEKRYLVIGNANNNRICFLVVTERRGKIRILSARYMHQKEVQLYEKGSSRTKI